MGRFKVFVNASLEVFASDRFEAFDIARDFADAMEEGDGGYLRELVEKYCARVRANYDSSQAQPLTDDSLRKPQSKPKPEPEPEVLPQTLIHKWQRVPAEYDPATVGQLPPNGSGYAESFP